MNPDEAVQRARDRLYALADECQREAEWLAEHARLKHCTYSAVADPVALFSSAALRAERAAAQCIGETDLDRADVEAETLTAWLRDRSRFRRLMDATWYIVR